jgi:hypothetical protein
VTYTTDVVIRGLARRIKSLSTEMRSIDDTLRGIIEQTTLPCSPSTVSGSTPLLRYSSQPAATPIGCTPNDRGRICAVSHRSLRVRGRPAAGSASTGAEIDRPTLRSTASC